MTDLKMWRFIDTGSGSAYWNMAVDEVLLEGFREGDLPILRVYGWENALSVGKFSNISKSVDSKKLENQKIPLVRRLSGGGVLVHGGDLSYTLIMSREFLKDKGIKENYRILCGFLIRLYEKLGIRRSDICLAGNEAYDIVIQGKKMGGNAQRYTRHTLFQHGSIPMSLNESLFKSLLRGESGLESAASLERLGTAMGYEPLSALMQETFSETFEINLVSDGLTPFEAQRVKELLSSKYTQKRWNFYGQFVST
jgi:lipoate-protein ligase A